MLEGTSGSEPSVLSPTVRPGSPLAESAASDNDTRQPLEDAPQHLSQQARGDQLDVLSHMALAMQTH